MDLKELYAVLADIQASPKECEWVEIKKDNSDPQMIGEYILRSQMVPHIWDNPKDI